MKKVILILLISFIGITSNAQLLTYYHGTNKTVTVSFSYDTDAQAFFTAANITNTTQKTAVNDFVIAYKSNGFWETTQIIYPIIGGTANSHKFNLKDPRDLDAAFRMDFVGAIIHDSSGMVGGTTGYGNTFFNPSIIYPSGLMSMGIYLKTNSEGTFVDIGAVSSSNRYTQIYSRLAGTFYGQINSSGITENVANTNSRGWYYASRPSSISSFIQRNTTQNSFTTNVSLPTNANIYVMAQNNGVGNGQYFSNRIVAFVIIGAARSTSEALTIRTLVQNFQTTLGRQV